MSGNEGFIRSVSVDRGELADEIRTRRERLAALMREHELDAVLVASEANAFYLTGYETTFFGNLSKPLAVIFAPPERPMVICHVGEEPSVRLDALDVDVHPYVGPEKMTIAGSVQIDYQLPAADAVLATLAKLDIKTVGFEHSWHFIPGFTPLALDRVRERSKAELRDASIPIWAARRIKSPWEIEQMHRAATVAEAAHAGVVADARVGMSERDINRLLREHSYRAGAEKIGYSGVIAGIDRAPLGGPTDRIWETGQLLFVDICLQLGGGYFADFNRVYASAPPTLEQSEAYQSVVDALGRARANARAGTSVADIAQAIIGDTPTIYARVGHGLGLEMPEPPSLSTEDPTPLQAGEVICIEPNMHVPGVGWLVSEETIAITKDGFDLLSPPFPTELAVIG